MEAQEAEVEATSRTEVLIEVTNGVINRQEDQEIEVIPIRDSIDTLTIQECEHGFKSLRDSKSASINSRQADRDVAEYHLAEEGQT